MLVTESSPGLRLAPAYRRIPAWKHKTCQAPERRPVQKYVRSSAFPTPSWTTNLYKRRDSAGPTTRPTVRRHLIATFESDNLVWPRFFGVTSEGLAVGGAVSHGLRDRGSSRATRQCSMETSHLRD